MDYISDGTTVISLHNGHEMLGRITGSGCIVGSAIATYCGVAASPEYLSSLPDNQKIGPDDAGRLVKGNMLLGAIAG